MIIPEIGVITNVILNLSEMKDHEIQREVDEAIQYRSLHTMPLKMGVKPFCQVGLDKEKAVNIYLKLDRIALQFDVVAIQTGCIMDKYE